MQQAQFMAEQMKHCERILSAAAELILAGRAAEIHVAGYCDYNATAKVHRRDAPSVAFYGANSHAQPLGLGLRMLDLQVPEILRSVGRRHPDLALHSEALLERLAKVPAIDDHTKKMAASVA
jgi:hypothetical protein